MTDGGAAARLLHDDAAGWDPRGTALNMVRDTLAKINHDRARKGLPRLADADMTLEQRLNAIGFILRGPQTVETLAAAAAQLVAAMSALLRAEDASPFTGDAA